MLEFLCNYRCVFCDTLTHRELDLCCACERELPFLHNYCVRCAQPLPEGQKICGFCLTSDTALKIETVALFHYQAPIDRLIMSLKFGANLVSARILGELLGSHLDNHYRNEIKPDVIIPVPLHSLRLRERGYNQALELARPVAKKLNIPLDKFSTWRTKNTEAQAKLSAAAREQNIKHAFKVERNFHAARVAIVDDVITTGNTVKELCSVLHAAGVNWIDIWCCAKS